MSEAQSLSIGEKIKEAGLHSIIYGLGSIAQSAITLLLLPILTGALSKDDFGAYSMVVMANAIASAVFYLGITSALPRSYFDYESDIDRRSVFTTAFLVLLSGAILQVVIGVIYATNISILLTSSPIYGDAVAWALFGGAIGFINQYFFAYLRILRKSIASVVFSLFSLIGTIGLTMVFLSSNPAGVIVPFEAIAYVQIAIAGIFLFIYSKAVFIWKINTEELPKMLHFGIAAIVASFGQMLLEWLDRLIIEHYMTLSDVGVYSAAFRVGILINIILVLPFTQVWTPMMMEYRNKSNIRELFSCVFSYFMIIGGILVIASSLFSQELLSLLIRSGVDQVTIDIFILVVFGALVFSAVNFFGAGLFYERKVYRLSYVYYGVAIIKGALNVIIIPLLGLFGAAISAMVAYVLAPIGVYYIAKTYFYFDIEWFRLRVLLLIMLPTILYVLSGGEVYHISYTVRIVWLLFNVWLIYMFCFSSTERKIIKNVVFEKVVNR